MKITRDHEHRRAVLGRLRERVLRQRPGIHVSDLLFCLRRAWHLQGKAPEAADGTVLSWSRGLSHEALLRGKELVVYGYCFACDHLTRIVADEAEEAHKAAAACRLCAGMTLIGTIDWIEEDGTIVECKSTTRKAPLEDTPWYLDQLNAYVWLERRHDTRYPPVGRVLVYFVGGSGRMPELTSFRVELDEEDIAATEMRLKERFEVLRGAQEPPLGDGSPSYDWVCRDCSVTTCERNPNSPIQLLS